MKKFSLKLVWKSLKDAFKGFGDDKVMKLSAALAYYTGFSLAPLLIVLISLTGFFFGREAIEGTIDNQIRGFIGYDAAKQIQDMIKNAAISGKGTIATIIGIVTLIIGATSIFGEVQDSINSIWGLKPNPKVGIMKTLQNRLLSFGLIASLGFLLLVSLAATSVVEGLGAKIQDRLPNLQVVFIYVINLLLTLGITTVLFAIIFKVLPDAKIKWKDIWPGAIATSLLFLLGKFGISLYISKSDLGSTYGAAGSLAVIFVWIYYSSIILYFGAEFTKAYALNKGAKVVPNDYAEWNHEPAVPGAEPKNTAADQKEKREEMGLSTAHLSPASTVRHQAEPSPKLETERRRDPGFVSNVSPRKKSAGIGTLLFGLALYFLNRRSDKKRESLSH